MLLRSSRGTTYILYIRIYSSQTINTETTIQAANGKFVKAKTVFAFSIKFLKEEAIKVICQRTGDEHFSASDIQWVLTVPAIWTPRAKQFMREAAYEVSEHSHSKYHVLFWKIWIQCLNIFLVNLQIIS